VLQQLDRQQHKRTALSVKAQHQRSKDVNCVNDPAGIGLTNVAYIITISVDNICGLHGLIDLAFAANDGHSFSSEMDSHQPVECTRAGKMKVEVKLSL